MGWTIYERGLGPHQINVLVRDAGSADSGLNSPP
jgi:hypothetical protein